MDDDQPLREVDYYEIACITRPFSGTDLEDAAHELAMRFFLGEFSGERFEDEVASLRQHLE